MGHVLPGIQYILAAILVWVILSDLLYRKISNRLNTGLFLLWILHTAGAASQIGPWKNIPFNWSDYVGYPLLGSTLIFIIGYGLFIIKRVGAGDVKLMTVLGLWAGTQQIQFVMITSLIGGVLALLLPLISIIELSLAHGLMWFTSKISTNTIMPPVVLGPEKPTGIPYGIAIAAGAAITFVSAMFSVQA